jgi:hypothetical protein
VFSLAGALGVLIISGVGGKLFDVVDPRAPFVLLGLMNLLVLIAALYVSFHARQPVAPPATATR